MSDLLSTYQQLFKYYGPRSWWPAESPFEMAIGAILTQNTNWKNVEKAIANLRSAQALTAPAIAALDRQELERLINPSGFFRQKAERLQLLARYLCENYQGSLERMLQQPMEPLREELLALKGVGPETADSILLYGGGHSSFVIDAYTLRLFSRLGLFKKGEKYAQARELFMQQLPEEALLYNEYHALIVMHCKEHCRKQPLCSGCPLAQDCAYRKQNP